MFEFLKTAFGLRSIGDVFEFDKSFFASHCFRAACPGCHRFDGFEIYFSGLRHSYTCTHCHWNSGLF